MTPVEFVALVAFIAIGLFVLMGIAAATDDDNDGVVYTGAVFLLTCVVLLISAFGDANFFLWTVTVRWGAS